MSANHASPSIAFSYWVITLTYRSCTEVAAATAQVRRDYNVSESTSRSGRELKVTLTWPGLTLSGAIDHLSSELAVLRDRHKLTIDPVSVDIRPNNIPARLPDIMTLVDIARLFGFSRQRARQMSARVDFPPPLARTTSGPIFDAIHVQVYKSERDNAKDKRRDARDER